MCKYVFFCLLFPFAVFSQSTVISTLYPVHSKDTIKSIAYPCVNGASGRSARQINNIIKASVFASDTGKSLQKLLYAIYKKDKGLKMGYIVNHTLNGFLSITINVFSDKSEIKPPIYLNFDLTTGKLITLHDMFKTRSDSFSFAQAVIPPVTDSIQLLEQSVDKNNPAFGEIIQWLNNSLSNFRRSYISKYIMTDKEIIVRYDCFIPHKFLSYKHTYQISFMYKAMKGIFKPDIIKRLIK